MSDEEIQLAVSIPEAAKRVGISRTRLYEEVSKGRLAVRKVGARTIIPVSELSAWLNALPRGGDR